jgi:uncharacterized membrane protein YbaN (DUF454 family)
MTNNPLQYVQPKNKKQKALRALLFLAGSLALVLGFIGIFVPLLPTTPFLLLAAACYMRSSERMHKWLITNRIFGEYIRNYQEGRGIPLKTKIFTIALLWISILCSMFFVINKRLIMPEKLIVQIILLIIAICVSTYVIRLPTLKKQINKSRDKP